MRGQIKIIQKSNKLFQEISQNLTHNQLILESRILQIEQVNNTFHIQFLLG